MQAKKEIRIRKPAATGHGTLFTVSMLLLTMAGAAQLGLVAQRQLVDLMTPDHYRSRPRVAAAAQPTSFGVESLRFN